MESEFIESNIEAKPVHAQAISTPNNTILNRERKSLLRTKREYLNDKENRNGTVSPAPTISKSTNLALGELIPGGTGAEKLTPFSKRSSKRISRFSRNYQKNGENDENMNSPMVYITGDGITISSDRNKTSPLQSTTLFKEKETDQLETPKKVAKEQRDPSPLMSSMKAAEKSPKVRNDLLISEDHGDFLLRDKIDAPVIGSFVESSKKRFKPTSVKDDGIFAPESFKLIANDAKNAMQATDDDKSDDEKTIDIYELAGEDIELLDFVKPKNSYAIFSIVMLLAFSIIMALEIISNGKFERTRINPLIGPNATTLINMGAKRASLIKQGDWWRWFTSLFLHAGIVHFALNMIAFVHVGFGLEREYGHAKTIAIYSIGGFIGILASGIFSGSQLTVAASAPVFALIGASWIELIQNRFLYTYERSLTIFLKNTLVTFPNIVIGFLPFVDNFANITGFVIGFLMGSFLFVRTKYFFNGKQKEVPTSRKAFKWTGCFLIPASILWMLACFYNDIVLTKSSCSWCQYVNCTPFPPGSTFEWWGCDICDQGGYTITTNETVKELNINCPSGKVNTTTYFEPTLTTMTIVNYCRQLCIE